jgi:hypothetical protein
MLLLLQATKIPLTQWNSDFSVITKGCAQLQTQLEAAKRTPTTAKNDRFVEVKMLQLLR